MAPEWSFEWGHWPWKSMSQSRNWKTPPPIKSLAYSCGSMSLSIASSRQLCFGWLVYVENSEVLSTSSPGSLMKILNCLVDFTCFSFHNCTASGNRNFWFSSVLKSNHHALMEIKSMLIEKTFSKLWIQFQNELHYSHEKWGIYDTMSFPVLLQNIFWFYKNFYRINEKGNFTKYF